MTVAQRWSHHRVLVLRQAVLDDAREIPAGPHFQEPSGTGLPQGLDSVAETDGLPGMPHPVLRGAQVTGCGDLPAHVRHDRDRWLPVIQPLQDSSEIRQHGVQQW